MGGVWARDYNIFGGPGRGKIPALAPPTKREENNKGDPAGIVTSNNKTIKNNDSESTKL